MLIVAQKKHAMGKSMTGVVVLLQTNVKKEEATAISKFLWVFMVTLILMILRIHYDVNIVRELC